jgi:hypothetical protein
MKNRDTGSTDMSDYQKEQMDALRLVRGHLAATGASEVFRLRELTAAYRTFRKETDSFLNAHFSQICSRNCYESRLSACCSKEGIITFFADVVINALFSDEKRMNRLQERLTQTNTGFKCIYLDAHGCLWHIKPIVCQMFLCDKAEKSVFTETPAAAETWERLQARRKEFTWPDRPVLFDHIETLFIEAGHSSAVMYLHNSPGLLMVKRRAGIPVP